MKRLGMALGSAARTEILRALAYQPGGVGVRQAARIAGVLPRSAELALAGLLRDHMVTRTRSCRRVSYRINRRHADVEVVEAVFSAAAQASVRARSRLLDARARSLLPFIREGLRMLNLARRKPHVARKTS